MKIVIKKLNGKERGINVEPTTSIIEIKRKLSLKLKVAVDQQKLLLMGKPLADNKQIQDYSTIKEGTKLHLIIQKPESLYEAAKKYYKQKGSSEVEAHHTANKLCKIIEDKIKQMSWDDIERLCKDMLRQEQGEDVSKLNEEHEPESDDGLGL